MSEISPHIPTLSEEDALSIGAENNILEDLAKLNVFRTLLHHPALAKVVQDMLMMLLANGNKLDARLRELIIMRIGWATGSDYEWTQHWRIALMFSIPEEQLLALRDWQASEYFCYEDRAILKAVDETLEGGRITAATWNECAKYLTTHEEMLELNAAIGAWRFISQLARSAQIELEDGVASWPPDGLQSPADI